MQKENESGAISTGDRRAEQPSNGPVETITVEDAIKKVAHKLVTRLKSLKAVKENPHLILKVNLLEDIDILYTLALQEQARGPRGYTKDMNKFALIFLPQFGLKQRDIPEDDLTKLQTAVQIIYGLFKNKVFNNDNEKKKFKKKKIPVDKKRKREEVVEEPEEESSEEEEEEEQPLKKVKVENEQVQ